MSTKLMQFLISFYLIIMLTALYERNYVRALYWFGAICLTIAVLIGGKK